MKCMKNSVTQKRAVTGPHARLSSALSVTINTEVEYAKNECNSKVVHTKKTIL